MGYQVTIRRSVLKALEKINDPDYSNIKDAIYRLADNPRSYGYKKLKGRPGYRVREGNYRIIYDIFDNTLIVNVIAVGHRKAIYD